MNQNGAKILMLTVLASLLIGVGVLVFNDAYTIEHNVESNRDYCPTINAYWDADQAPAAAPRRQQERPPRRSNQ